jgi:hypothetical protein
VDSGIGERKDLGDVVLEWEVRSMEADSWEERVRRAVVRRVEARVNGVVDDVDVDVDVEVDERISPQNASTSSTTMLWILRSMLRCRDPSKRYSDAVSSVARRADHDAGRKICTCCSAFFTVSLITGLRITCWRAEILDSMSEMHTSASRLTLKCDNGSSTRMAAFSPPRGMVGLKEIVDGRMARAVMR